MKRCQTEYQDKYWDYNKGFQIEDDPYEALVRATHVPHDFSAAKKKTTKPKRKINKQIQENPSENKKCFVSSSGNKIEIQTRIIIHKPGAYPEKCPESEFDEASSSQGMPEEIHEN